MTDTSLVIEAVARALCERDASVDPALRGVLWHLYEEDARAALASALDAMMEPSDAMDLAGTDSFQWGGPEGAEWLEAADSTECWKAMHAQFKKEVLGDG